MESILSSITANRNIYTINKDRKHLFLTHPLLVPHLYGTNEESSDYYSRKASYLRKHGYLTGINHSFEGELTAQLVEQGIANLGQLVFEVTDACNLRCKYCGYGELYGDFDERKKKMLDVDSAKKIIDFLNDTWKRSKQKFTNKSLFISFYGGEPLMNMPFIQQVIDYVESLNITHRTIKYSMTTNAMLLDRYMDYLAEKEFNLLISLDGNEQNNGYRVMMDGRSSFERNVTNVDALKQRHPGYFEKYVNFNAVLHNKNTVGEIFDFVRQRYDKKPRIASLNTTGVLPQKRDEFNAMYRNMVDDIRQNEDYEVLVDEMFMDVPEYHEACTFVQQYNGNVYRSYNDLFGKRKARNFIPTGTCLPFTRKMFITVNGKILACERIGQQYGLGIVAPDKEVDLSYKEIADLYNTYYRMLRAQCGVCYQSQSCIQCMWTIDNLDKQEKVKCPGFMNKEGFAQYVSRNLAFLEAHPEAYMRVMEVVLA